MALLLFRKHYTFVSKLHIRIKMIIENEQISTWLSAERRWYACVKWMHLQGRKVSLMTLRRAFKQDGATARQRLAIDLARQYHAIVTTAPPLSGGEGAGG